MGNDAFDVYNGKYVIEGLLECYWDGWAPCGSKDICLATGECNDWNYEAWGNNKVCRIPFIEAEEWGYPKSVCQGYQWGSGSLNLYGENNEVTGTVGSVAEAWADYQDACIVKLSEESKCSTDLQGTIVARAKSLSECQSDMRSGCFNTQADHITAISMTDCQNEDLCDPEQYDWDFVHDWSAGNWSSAQLIDFSWKQREFASINSWGPTVSVEGLRGMMRTVLYSLIGKAYIAEARCEMEPILYVLESVACGCGGAKDAVATAKCDKVFNDLTCPTISESVLWSSKLWQNKKQTEANSGGSTAWKYEELKANSDLLNFSHSAVEMLTKICPAELEGARAQIVTSRRSGVQLEPMSINKRREMVAMRATGGCDSTYETVKNSGGDIVGQLVGNGVQLEGVQTGTTTLCIPLEISIPVCLRKYDTMGMAVSLGDGFSSLLDVTVTQDNTNKFCAEVDVSNVANGKSVYPVMTTADKTAFVAFTGSKVTKSLRLSLASKELFTLKRMQAFTLSIAQALAGIDSTLDATTLQDAVVITAVCDSNGCINYNSRRRSGTSGIDVTFEVQGKAGVDLTKAETALDSSTFKTTLVQKMSDNGVPGLTISEVPESTPQPGGGGTDTTTSAPVVNGSCRSSPLGSWHHLALALLSLSIIFQ
mmetsp:Transcript_18192/g.28227  ORF Transcript_18192/g.28227 Transcript_18192/m.28227 type:complete len:652 (+) Transcript_18192:575-2530(+)